MEMPTEARQVLNSFFVELNQNRAARLEQMKRLEVDPADADAQAAYDALVREQSEMIARAKADLKKLGVSFALFDLPEE